MEEKVNNILECFGTGDNFLQSTQFAKSLRSMVSKLDLKKQKRIFKAEDTFIRTKLQPTERENIFIKSSSVRGLISKINKGLKKLDISKPNNPIKNGVQI